jgi:hypothetical protein
MDITKEQRDHIRANIAYKDDRARAETEILSVFNRKRGFSRQKLVDCLKGIRKLDLIRPVITGEWTRLWGNCNRVPSVLIQWPALPPARMQGMGNCESPPYLLFSNQNYPQCSWVIPLALLWGLRSTHRATLFPGEIYIQNTLSHARV